MRNIGFLQSNNTEIKQDPELDNEKSPFLTYSENFRRALSVDGIGLFLWEKKVRVTREFTLPLLLKSHWRNFKVYRFIPFPVVTVLFTNSIHRKVTKASLHQT